MKLCKDCKHCEPPRSPLTGAPDYERAICRPMRHVWGFARCADQRAPVPDGRYHISDVDCVPAAWLAKRLCGPEAKLFEAKT